MKATLFFLSLVTAVVGKMNTQAMNRGTTPFWLVDGLDGEFLFFNASPLPMLQPPSRHVVAPLRVFRVYIEPPFP